MLTNSLGYDLPEVREAVERQLRTGIVHTSTLYLIRQQVELAEKIARLSGIPDARVFFTNSGTEANEAALQVATKPAASNSILAVRNSYHGRTAATIGGDRQPGLVGLGAQPVQRELPALRGPAARACCKGHVRRAATSRRPRRTSARSSPRPPPARSRA